MAPQPRPVANRDETIPVLMINDGDEADDPESTSSGKSQSKVGPSSSALHEKLKDGAATADSGPSRSSGIQDRLFSLMFQQILPNEAHTEQPQKVDRRGAKNAARPNFSLPLMSNNFRRFNARIGVVFVFESRAIRLFSWRIPSQTWSFLAVYSFFCLEPGLLPILPLAICLLFVMVPAFMARHPPPPNIQSNELYEIQGPASAPPPIIKPAPETSKDFFRNMRDLQNSMEDFSVLHDKVIHWIAPLTNFSDERVSSTIFLALALITFTLFVASSLLPWRLLFLIGGWVMVASTHPNVARLIASIDKQPLKLMIKRAHSRLERWMIEDIVLDETPEVRQVEVFELQHRHGEEWQPWIFSVSPYTPHAPLRVAGDRPRGTRFFEDVAPPKGWEWSNKKWTLDLYSREWVEERNISAVEVETEGERWVYDIATLDHTAEDSQRAGKRVEAHRKDWEESSGSHPLGEWRRRRWVRLVKRRALQPQPSSSLSSSSSS